MTKGKVLKHWPLAINAKNFFSLSLTLLQKARVFFLKKFFQVGLEGKEPTLRVWHREVVFTVDLD
jgi:hypothetical protein